MVIRPGIKYPRSLFPFYFFPTCYFFNFLFALLLVFSFRLTHELKEKKIGINGSTWHKLIYSLTHRSYVYIFMYEQQIAIK